MQFTRAAGLHFAVEELSLLFDHFATKFCSETGVRLGLV
jgi:hypothetical protein